MDVISKVKHLYYTCKFKEYCCALCIVSNIIVGLVLIRCPDYRAEMDIWDWILRIDNRRQSVICATLHFSLVMCYRVSYYIPNDSLYFSLSNHIDDTMVHFIFWKL